MMPSSTGRNARVLIKRSVFFNIIETKIDFHQLSPDGLSCFTSGACYCYDGCYFPAMKQIILILFALVGGYASVIAGTPQGAERIAQECRLAELEWQQQMLAARTAAQKLAIVKMRPDLGLYSSRMVVEIGSALNQKWTMPYIIWLLNYHGGLTEREVSNLIDLIEKFHMDSPMLGEFCISLAPAGKSTDQPAQASIDGKVVNLTMEKIRFIESIINSKRNKPLRGQSCLALSGVLASMGDSAEINKRRLDLIRKAIINAADTKVGESTVADLAKEEIYRMTKLSKRAIAPDLIGRDSRFLPMKLSDFRGKVVVLVFWTSWEQPIEVLDFLRKLEKSYLGKKVQIIGVNRDSRSDLREIEMAQKTSGKNFTDPNGDLYKVYRVTDSPVCYVLDGKGVIQYNGPLGSFVDLTVSALLAPAAK
jgi:peroxiredoxin